MIGLFNMTFLGLHPYNELYELRYLALSNIGGTTRLKTGTLAVSGSNFLVFHRIVSVSMRVRRLIYPGMSFLGLLLISISGNKIRGLRTLTKYGGYGALKIIATLSCMVSIKLQFNMMGCITTKIAKRETRRGLTLEGVTPGIKSEFGYTYRCPYASSPRRNRTFLRTYTFLTSRSPTIIPAKPSTLVLRRIYNRVDNSFRSKVIGVIFGCAYFKIRMNGYYAT